MDRTEAMMQNSFTLDEKVAFLRQPHVYPFPTHSVKTKETHMSWIFITDDFVYKLKKPVKYKYIDHRSLISRFKDCRREIRLNKKMAEEIYLGLVPLTSCDGTLKLSGNELIEEWLVKMKRIPEDKMLDHQIKLQCVDEKKLQQAALLLVHFYAKQSPVEITAHEHRKKLQLETNDTYKELLSPDLQLPAQVIEKLTGCLLGFLDKHHVVFDKRVSHKKIIETHGDLRPEHVCLTDAPVIIDRLEFNRSLRIQDMAEELSYFAMECEMLGNPQPGNIFFDTYFEQTSDHIDPSLILFYKIKRACLRAYLVARHIRDQKPKTKHKWISRATHYLDLATKYNRKLVV